jgi:hypothetical protein
LLFAGEPRRHLGGLVEDRSLAVGRGRLLGAGVDLLEHPRDRGDERRPEQRELLGEAVDPRREPDRGAGLDAGQREDLGERVRERQEQQLGVTRLDQLVDHGEGLDGVPPQVAVGQHAALGASGGAGGVDERGDVGGGQGREPLVQDLVAELGAGLGEPGLCALVDDQDVLGGDGVRDRIVDRGLHRGGLQDGGHGTGVGQDPLHLLGRGGLVDRHGDAAGGQDRVVEQRPLDPRR